MAANWRANLDTNLISAVLMTAAVRDRLADGGVVINIGSIAATSTGRAGTPDDIAGTVHFLASPAARQITGQVLAINGGERTTR